MKKSKRNIGSDLAKVDAYVNTKADYDELPEWTDEMFDQADLYHGNVLIRRGRPKKAVTAKSIAIRLAPEVESYFRSLGKGWQSHINKVLKDYVAKNA